MYKMQIVMLDINKEHIETQLQEQVKALMDTEDSINTETLHEVL